MIRLEKLENRRLLDAVPVGPEFRVTMMTGGQSEPAVASDASGNFVIAWRNGQGATGGSAVYAQRYDAAGTPLGNAFRVSPDTPGTDLHYDPSVAMDADGDFVVAWTREQSASSTSRVYARQFDPAGTPRGEAFLADPGAWTWDSLPSVATDANGNFVIAWFAHAGTGVNNVFARRFDSSGVPLGDSVHVGAGWISSVAMDADGDFVVAWQRAHDFNYDVYARRYNASGVAQGAEIPVNTHNAHSQAIPDVAMNEAGDFVVVWNSVDQKGPSYGVYARRYAAAGAALGGEVLVNSYTTREQREPAVAMDASGEFVVAWQSADQDGSGYGVYAQAFNGAGARNGGELRVHSSTLNGQVQPAVAMDADGDFVVAWRSGHTSPASVFAQRFTEARAPIVTESRFHFETAPHRITITFDADVSASLSLDDLLVTLQSGGPAISPSGLSYDPATNTATVTLGGALPDGRYRAMLLAAGITTAAGVPMAGDHVLSFFFLQGDANHDAVVNLADFNILAANFGQSNRDFTQGDFNYDGTVNLADFNLLAGRFGQAVGAAGASDDQDAPFGEP